MRTIPSALSFFLLPSSDNVSPASPRLSPSCASSPTGRPASSRTTMATGAVEERLKQLDITLPEVAPAGNYVLHRRSGDTLYMSGHLPKAPDGTLTTGKVGSDLEVEQGAEAARLVAINLITTMKAAAGDLDKIRLVKITGFVRSADGFAGQSAVLNGASDLFMEVFGREKGAHARSAVGVNALPLGVCVEIEAIVEMVS
ncbi:unnamed protein product [Ectocarpus sp. 13 AM-2016]